MLLKTLILKFLFNRPLGLVPDCEDYQGYFNKISFDPIGFKNKVSLTLGVSKFYLILQEDK